jgi:hypothetical protein
MGLFDSKTLWLVDPLLGNEPKINSYATAIAK